MRPHPPPPPSHHPDPQPLPHRRNPPLPPPPPIFFFFFFSTSLLSLSGNSSYNAFFFYSLPPPPRFFFFFKTLKLTYVNVSCFFFVVGEWGVGGEGRGVRDQRVYPRAKSCLLISQVYRLPYYTSPTSSSLHKKQKQKANRPLPSPLQKTKQKNIRVLRVFPVWSFLCELG